MNSNYVAEIQSTCIPDEQHVSGDTLRLGWCEQTNEQTISVDIMCIRIQVARPGYMFPGDICPGANGALEFDFGADIGTSTRRAFLICALRQ